MKKILVEWFCYDKAGHICGSFIYNMAYESIPGEMLREAILQEAVALP